MKTKQILLMLLLSSIGMTHLSSCLPSVKDNYSKLEKPIIVVAKASIINSPEDSAVVLRDNKGILDVIINNPGCETYNSLDKYKINDTIRK